MPSLTQICELVAEDFPERNIQLIRSPKSREKLWTANIYDAEHGPKFGHWANESTPEAALIAALSAARRAQIELDKKEAKSNGR